MTYTFILLAMLSGQPQGSFLVKDEMTCIEYKAKLDAKGSDFDWSCVPIGGVLEDKP